MIHRNLSIERQREEVEKVKRSANGIIEDPVTLTPTATVGEARGIMRTQNISGLPILEQGTKKVVGIPTRRDTSFHENDETPVKEVMTSKDLVTAPPGTSLEEARERMHFCKVEKLIIVDGDGNLAGLITRKDVEMLAAFPNAASDEQYFAIEACWNVRLHSDMAVCCSHHGLPMIIGQSAKSRIEANLVSAPSAVASIQSDQTRSSIFWTG